MALCVAYGFASAQAAIFSAAEAARFHTGERHMYPRPARLRLVKLRFARLRSAKHCFRNLSTAPDRLCRYSLPLAFYAENAALALRYPSHNYSATGRSCEKA